MNTNKRCLLLAAFTLISMTSVVAQTTYDLGSILTQNQIHALGAMKTFTVDNGVFRIISNSPGIGGNVINDQGRVGRCDAEIVISGIPTDQAKKSLDPYQSTITSVKVYDSLKIVSVHFSTMSDAAKARNELSNLLTGATITLPIIFALPKAR